MRLLVLGDEILAEGPARDGRVRDSLGPQLPGWLDRLGVDLVETVHVEDTYQAQSAALAAAVQAADLVITTGHDFDQARKELHHMLSKLISAHAEADKLDVRRSDEVLAPVEMLADAAGAQWRFLRARVDELAKATTGLDVVALTRVLHAVLNLHLDLERRILSAQDEPPHSS